LLFLDLCSIPKPRTGPKPVPNPKLGPKTGLLKSQLPHSLAPLARGFLVSKEEEKKTIFLFFFFLFFFFFFFSSFFFLLLFFFFFSSGNRAAINGEFSVELPLNMCLHSTQLNKLFFFFFFFFFDDSLHTFPTRRASRPPAFRLTESYHRFRLARTSRRRKERGAPPLDKELLCVPLCMCACGVRGAWCVACGVWCGVACGVWCAWRVWRVACGVAWCVVSCGGVWCAWRRDEKAMVAVILFFRNEANRCC